MQQPAGPLNYRLSAELTEHVQHTTQLLGKVSRVTLQKAGLLPEKKTHLPPPGFK